MSLLNVGCGPHYADGWINTDVYQDDLVKPDIIVSRESRYPFDDCSFDAAYLGHVIEHIEWTQVASFISEISRIVKPGAPILIVGPDIKKTIDLYSSGDLDWDSTESILEHQHFNYQDSNKNSFWDGASHFWNCHYERVAMLLRSIGIEDIQNASEEIARHPLIDNWYDVSNGIIWPIVAKVKWQFGILFKNKK